MTAANPDRAADFSAPPDGLCAKDFPSAPAAASESASESVLLSGPQRHRGTPRHEITMVDNLDLFAVKERPTTAAPREGSRAPERSPPRSSDSSFPARTGATPDADACRSGRSASRLLRSSSGSTCTAWQPFSRASLTHPSTLCYGAPLGLPSERSGQLVNSVLNLSTIFGAICHELYRGRIVFWFILVYNLEGQIFTPALPPVPPPPPQVSPDV